jgi:hypothetical protein
MAAVDKIRALIGWVGPGHVHGLSEDRPALVLAISILVLVGQGIDAARTVVIRQIREPQSPFGGITAVPALVG